MNWICVPAAHARKTRRKSWASGYSRLSRKARFGKHLCSAGKKENQGGPFGVLSLWFAKRLRR
ncbi:hypothetical protein Geu3261_0142_021 [Komagataeibacter europaeus NBRC 3261]|uniref:Uncharacterized protein n=1 Tax=Komagataeibacter europaeus NBRC 3261 TaxID=1234669 RepID=A0A0D6Q1D3_KOMEU|nr:hypothetical protein Geu3261_0142_021 [Komagataeibacter europaeus NBRC 3261]